LPKTAVVIPDTNRLLEVLVRLHDDVRQIQYPYSAKVRKYGIISLSEIESAIARDPSASEVTVWTGQKATDVASRIAGGLTNFIDQEGYREKWVAQGMAEGSWKTFLSLYCRLKADSTPFTSESYYRNFELENLLALIEILDDEIFSHSVMSHDSNHSAAFKSKWFKECHRILAEAVREEVYRSLKLPERPKEGLCYTPAWPKDLTAEIRKIAVRWRKSPLWEQKQSTNPDDGVDFTNNNEATVKQFLTTHNFTTAYLEGR
jgi:hypothetical protein